MLWLDPKLIIRVINFELVQLTRLAYINITDGQTDGRVTIAIPRGNNTWLLCRHSSHQTIRKFLNIETLHGCQQLTVVNKVITHKNADFREQQCRCRS